MLLWTPTVLSALESALVRDLRGLVILDDYPDPAVVDTVAATAADAQAQGQPFDQLAVLAVLYPNAQEYHRKRPISN